MSNSMAHSHLSLNLHSLNLSTPFRSSPRSFFPHRSAKIFTTSLAHRVHVIRVMPPSSVDAGEPSNTSIVKETTPSNLPKPGGPVLPLPNIPAWAKWGLASLVCLVVPFYKRILTIEDKVEKAAESTVEVVEKVVEVVEKVASDVAEAWPENVSLRKDVMELEEIAEDIDKDAQEAENFIHKVDEIKEEIEKVVQPIIEEGENPEKENAK